METSDHSGYLKTIEKKLDGILKKAPEKFDGEDYHHLRVEVKKLNALADSIKFCSSGFNKDPAFKSLKKIFKQAGKIRELQLEETMLQNHSEGINEYLTDLDNRIGKEKKRFSAAINKKSTRKIKKIFRGIEPYMNNMTDVEVDEFIKAERNKIRKLTEERPLNPANVHQIRKLLKVDFYNRKRLNLPDPRQLIKEEDQFLELLGKWHDCRILNSQLGTSILHGKVSPFELSNLLNINDGISLNAENLFKEIKASLERGIY